MAHKFVDELPAGAKKASKSTIFTDDLPALLRENEGRWLILKGATGQGAAAWVKRMDMHTKGFEYASVDTGKPDGEPRAVPNGEGTYQPTKKDIYVRFDPEKESKPEPIEEQASQDAAAAQGEDETPVDSDEDPADSIA